MDSMLQFYQLKNSHTLIVLKINLFYSGKNCILCKGLRPVQNLKKIRNFMISCRWCVSLLVYELIRVNGTYDLRKSLLLIR